MKKIALIVLLQISLIACSSFAYKFYGLEIPDGCYQLGQLVGHKPADDLPLTLCQPDAINKGKCAVMLTDEFERLRTAHTKCLDDLMACQAGH